MNLLCILIAVLATAVAEPPVSGSGDRSHHDGHHAGHYLPPSSHSAESHDHTPVTTYGAPNFSPSSQYGPPDSHHNDISHHNDFTWNVKNINSGRPSKKYGSPAGSGFSSPASQLKTIAMFGDSYSQSSPVNSFHQSSISDQYGPPTRNGPSQEYGVPTQGNSQAHLHGAVPSQIYGTPMGFGTSSRNDISQEYGLPSTRNGISQEYGASAARNGLSQSYGAPALENGPNFHSSSSSNHGPSQQYGTPAFGAEPSQEYGTPSFRNSPIQLHGTPANRNGPSQQFGVPPSLRSGLSRQYGAPNHRLDKGVNAPGLNSYGSESQSKFLGRLNSNSQLRQGYGNSSPLAKSFDTGIPSNSYRTPSQLNPNSGYNYKRNGEDDLSNQGPANYEFSYQVQDQDSGADFGHREHREDSRAEGSYFVVLPDGSKQVVEYEADEHGFKPRISVEPPAGYPDRTGASGGPY